MNIRKIQFETVKKPIELNSAHGLIVLILSILACPTMQAYAQFGPADAVGRALENAGRNIRRGVQNAVDATQGPVVVYENPLVARVYSRLQWEKLLAGSTLELEVRDDGTAVLRGEVASKEAKERAFLLARDTIGINRVIDELRVPASATKIVPDPDAPALEPLPGTPAASGSPPPVTGPAAVIRIRPSRVVRRRPAGSTTVTVRPAPVVPVPVPVVPAPVVEEVPVQP
jgi:hypothetical protein